MARKTKEQKEEEFIQFLKDKKAKDGKLSKIGEWFLSGKTTGYTIDKKNMRYILK
jgi:hypothetical protein